MRAGADILIYALGGGMGHLVRSTALARAIRETGAPRATIIATPGFTHLLDSRDYKLKIIPTPDNPTEYRSRIIETIRKINPKILVTDALPMGLMGELRDYLPQFKGRKALVARLLRGDYRDSMGVDDFVRANYDLVIRAERLPEGFLHHPRSVETPPILTMDAAELPTRKKAREKLKAREGKFLIMVVGTDPPDQMNAFFAVADKVIRNIGDPRVELRFASPFGGPSPSDMHSRHFPLMELLPGIDLVVGHAGYHLFHECVAARARALLFPRPRLYDDQEMRVTLNPGAIDTFTCAKELDAGIRKILDNPPKRNGRPLKIVSGAHEAAKIILAWTGISILPTDSILGNRGRLPIL